MPRSLPMTLQTVWAELVERCAIDRVESDFPAGGSFYKRTVKGNDYWYFKPGTPTEQGRRAEKYLGPDTEFTRKLVERERQAKAAMKERRAMVVALQRAGLKGPDPLTGRILAALADAGAFRLRAVVVGSVAFQAYGGMLGSVFSTANATTSDLDLAQFLSISSQVDDVLKLPLEEILRSVDGRFRPVPKLKAGVATQFVLGNDQYRVDVLVPNRGPDTDDPVFLPALQAEGQPLRYLDFLIYREVAAVVLHGDGILVNVPAPERFALHKLLVSRLRIKTSESQAKAAKDLRQAAELLEVLVEQRPYELRDLWSEMRDRGPSWRRLADEALEMLGGLRGAGELRRKLLDIIRE